MTAHRYWRIYIRNENGSSYVSVAELEFRATSGGADQTGSGTPLEGTHSGGYVPANAFDGDTGTVWAASNSLPNYIGYDFGAGNDVEVEEIFLRCSPSYTAEAPRRFEVQYSDDGSTWEDHWYLSDITGWAAGEGRSLAKPVYDAAHRYWRCRVETHNNGGNSWHSIADLELRATVGGADQTGSGTAIGFNVSGYPPANAFDANMSSVWANNFQPPDWVGYDFGVGNSVDVTEVKIRASPSYPNESPKAFSIDFSDNGYSWATRWGESDETGWSAGEERVFSTSQAAALPPVNQYLRRMRTLLAR